MTIAVPNRVQLFLASLFFLSSAINSAYATNAITNGGFEEPVLTPAMNSGNFYQFPQADVPGWSTTASDGEIEIWSRNFSGAPFAEGEQHAELNASFAGGLFQTVTGIPSGATVGFSFQHRGRDSVDSLRLTIIDLGADGLLDGVDDTELFNDDFTAQPGFWITNTGIASIQTLGNPIRFGFESLEVTTPQNGNFLDDVQFGIGIGIPEPNSLALLAGSFLLFGSIRLQRG